MRRRWFRRVCVYVRMKMCARLSPLCTTPHHTASQFITSDENGVYTVHREAIQVLEGITSPLGVVAVAGMWRTGKSFLLNSLLGLNGKEDAFVVGSTVNACTKGLWIWGGESAEYVCVCVRALCCVVLCCVWHGFVTCVGMVWCSEVRSCGECVRL